MSITFIKGQERELNISIIPIPGPEPDLTPPGNIITADILVGQNSYCNTWVRNKGTAEGDISCAWYLDNVYIETDSAFNVLPGTSTKFYLITPVLTKGSHTVRAEFIWDGHVETRTGSFNAR